MNIAISLLDASSAAHPDPHFGRAAAFLLVDVETGQQHIKVNPAAGTSSGAGVKAAEFVIRQGAGAVISGSFGPKACDVLAAAGVRMYRAQADTVADLLQQYQAGRLEQAKATSSHD